MHWGVSCLAAGLFASALQQPLAAAAPDGDWLDRLSAFKCRHSIEFDAPSVDPLLFTMIAACWRKQPRPEPHQGPYSLIALDAAREELRVLRISAFNAGGIHYAADGRIIWFSELNRALIGQEQRFVEAFSLEPQALEERSLGRIDLPFIAGSSSITRGADCHVLRIASRAVTGGPPVEHRFLLFDDRDPIGSRRDLTGIEHVLLFEPQSRVFVVETAVAGDASADTVQRAALDCSAKILPLDNALAGHLAQVDDSSRRYWAAAPTGEILSTGYTPGERRALLFRGAALTRFPPVISCFDPTTCDSYFAAGRGWSPSGDHFALLQYGGALEGTLEVYRTADLAVVHARPWDLHDRFLFADDEAVYFVTRRGRFVHDAWR
jgi:hypothetical protein